MQPLHRRVFTGKATDIGWLTGKEKMRLELSVEGIKTKRFAIALFNQDKIQNPNNDFDVTNKKWVRLKDENNQYVYADISSLAKRFKWNEEYIVGILQNQDQGIEHLETKITEHIIRYELKDKDKIALPEKITQEVIDNNLLGCLFWDDVSGTVKLKLAGGNKDPEKNFKTDGYLYKTKPEPAGSYIPYSYDKGETWYRIDSQDLEKHFLLDPENIQEAVKDPSGQMLLNLIIFRFNSLRGVHHLEEAGIKEREVFDGNATHIGLFSGKEKKRLELIPGNRRFAVGVLTSWDPDEENITWVGLESKKGKVKVEVSSLAKRLDMSEKEICALAEANILALESEIQRHIEDFQNIQKLKDLAEKNIIGRDQELQAIISKIHTPKIANKITKIWGNGDWFTFFKKLEKAFPLEKDQIYWKKITEATTIGDTEIINAKAFFDFYYTSNEAVRIKLINDENDVKNRFAIKTDGRLYNKRPEGSNKYVPYMLDDKHWMLINIKSLSHRLRLTTADITEQAQHLSGAEFKGFIKEKTADFIVEQNELQKLFIQKLNAVINNNNFQLSKKLEEFKNPFDDLLCDFKNLRNRIELDIFASNHFWWDYTKNVDPSLIIKLKLGHKNLRLWKSK